MEGRIPIRHSAAEYGHMPTERRRIREFSAMHGISVLAIGRGFKAGGHDHEAD